MNTFQRVLHKCKKFCKSDIFNKFFASKCSVPGAEEPAPDLPPKESIFETLSNFNTSPIEVAKLCRDIKKSNSSHCGIPGKFLSLISTPISFPLSRLYNNLFEIGHFQNLSHHSLIQGIRSKIQTKKITEGYICCPLSAKLPSL